MPCASSARWPRLDEFLRGYLIAYNFWLGLSLGCLALLMVQYLSGGLWGLVLRRVLEAAAKVLPLMFVLFLPILFGRHHLYAWMNNPALTSRNIGTSTHRASGAGLLDGSSTSRSGDGWPSRLIRRGDKQDHPLVAARGRASRELAAWGWCCMP